MPQKRDCCNYGYALNHSFGENPQVQMYFNSAVGEWDSLPMTVPGLIDANP